MRVNNATCVKADLTACGRLRFAQVSDGGNRHRTANPALRRPRQQHLARCSIRIGPIGLVGPIQTIVCSARRQGLQRCEVINNRTSRPSCLHRSWLSEPRARVPRAHRQHRPQLFRRPSYFRRSSTGEWTTEARFATQRPVKLKL